MVEPRSYDDRTTHAVYAVLIELGQVLGAYTDRFVVVGGSVPWLLYPNSEPRHLGTLDVDLSLDHKRLGDGQYATVVELLEHAGYVRGQDGMAPYQMVRTVPIDHGDPVRVMVDFLMPRRAKVARNRPSLVADFDVINADGADIANANFVQKEFSGQMPDGRANTVKLRIASIPALLVMKGYAVVGRDKAKDSYDIYYVIKHFEEGIDALRDACVPLMQNPVAKEAYGNIAAKFSSRDAYGPQTVAKFLLESGALGGMTRAQAIEDAYQQVRAWLARMGLA